MSGSHLGIHHARHLRGLRFLARHAGLFRGKNSAGYAIGGRSVPFIAFLMAATAASFSGWTFIGHPGLIWRDGLSYAFASFYVLTIPISGTFFAKRQWLLGKRYGFITPGDMYAYYFNSEPMRFLVVIAALLYSLFYSAVQMMASAALFQWVADVPSFMAPGSWPSSSGSTCARAA